MLKIAAVLPAYNEAARIADVLRAVLRAPSVEEVVVVNDGSTDATAKIVREFPEVCLVNLPVNRGKGGAMVAGAGATDADVLVFLDADLIGLKPEHVEELVRPVRTGRAQMTVGKFRGGRKLTDWSQKLVPNISGQRAILRERFEEVPDLEHSRYGVEMAITRFCHYYRVPTETVLMPGVTHPMKEEKLGLLRGCLSRSRMYYEIFKIVMNPRAPRRLRPRRLLPYQFPRLLRKLAANRRRNGHADGTVYKLYKHELSWRKRRQESKTKL
jgi:glycosyltransferase involved in cell wall biosynthesis